ncbi:hypothetical protein A2U01_0012698, partial [Trifolium medium]|nr:hypothetical protein [Trifolium medium]
LVGVPENGEHLCYVRFGRRRDRLGLIHWLFLCELWTLSQLPLRDFLNFIFVLHKGRGFLSISRITGNVFRYPFIVILHRRENGVVLPRGRVDDGVLIAVDVVV